MKKFLTESVMKGYNFVFGNVKTLKFYYYFDPNGNKKVLDDFIPISHGVNGMSNGPINLWHKV